MLRIYLLAILVNLLVFNDSWNWRLVGAYLFSPRVLLGIGNTIWLTLLALFFGLLLGLVVCMARLSRYPLLRGAMFCYVWVTRATPPLVVLLLIYFLGVLKPTLSVGLPFMNTFVEWPTNDLITPFTAAVVGLSFYLGGKSAEIFRSGYLAIGAGQHEAVKALGLPPRTALMRVIGPQALRALTPPLANEVVTARRAGAGPSDAMHGASGDDDRAGMAGQRAGGDACHAADGRRSGGERRADRGPACA